MSTLVSVLLTIAVIGVLMVAVFLLVALKTPSPGENVSFADARRLAVDYLRENLPDRQCGEAFPTGRQDVESWLVEVPFEGARTGVCLVCKQSGRVTVVGRSQQKKVQAMVPYRETD